MHVPVTRSDLSPNVVATPKDYLFSVERIISPPYFVAAFRTHLRYKESRRRTMNAREVVIPTEVIAPNTIVLSRDAIQRWEPPHEAELLDDTDRDRILWRIREAAMMSSNQWEVQAH